MIWSWNYFLPEKNSFYDEETFKFDAKFHIENYGLFANSVGALNDEIRNQIVDSEIRPETNKKIQDFITKGKYIQFYSFEF